MLRARTKLAMVLSFLLVMLLSTGTALATSIGSGPLPSWTDDATWTDINADYDVNCWSEEKVAAMIF